MASGPGGSQVLPRGTVRGRDGAPPPPSRCTRGLAAARTAAWPWTSPCTALPLPPASELPAMLPCSIYLLSSCPASPTAHTDRECRAFTHWHPKKLVPSLLSCRSTTWVLRGCLLGHRACGSPLPPHPTSSLTCCGWEKQEILLSKAEAQ